MSSKCPYCSTEIPSRVFVDGGHCPSCGELILGEWEDNDVTELLTFDEVTEQLEITQPFPKNAEKISEESDLTEDNEAEMSEEDFGIEDEKSVPQKPTVVNLDVPFNSLDGRRGYLLDEESSEELLDLPGREEAQYGETLPPQKEEEKKASKSYTIPLALVGLVIVGFAGANFLGMFDENEEVVISYENKTFEHLATDDVEIKEVEVKEEEVKKKASQKEKKKQVVEEITVGGITTFKSSGPVLSRSAGGASSQKSTSQKLQDDITDLQKSLQYCHTRALKKDPTIRGKWEVSFTIQTTGKASSIQLKALREKHSEMEHCMKTRIERFSFTKPSSSSYQKFRMTFG